MSALQWLAASLLAATAYVGAMHYSFKRYPNLGCPRCGGTGKIWEPIILTWLALRRRRAWGPCPSCSGDANYARKSWFTR